MQQFLQQVANNGNVAAAAVAGAGAGVGSGAAPGFNPTQLHHLMQQQQSFLSHHQVSNIFFFLKKKKRIGLLLFLYLETLEKYLAKLLKQIF